MLILFLFFPFSLSIDTGNCYEISCGTSNSSINCIEVDGITKQVTLNSCIYGCDYSSLYLPSTSFTNISCKSSPLVPSVTGSACEKASDCYSNICSVPICYGVSQNKYCPNDEACQPGFYCDSDSFTCQPSLNPGDSCNVNNECPVGYGCDFGICTLFFSIDEGNPASENIFCKSNWVFGGVCDSILVYYNGKRLFPPFECKIGEFCTYTSYVTEVVYANEPCTCQGILNKGGGLCSNFLEWSNDLVQDNYVYLTYTYSSCSGNYSHSDDPDVLLMCGSISQQQHDFMFNLRGQSRYWALYKSEVIEDCSVKYNLFNYSYNFSEYENSQNIGIFAVLMGLTILI